MTTLALDILHLQSIATLHHATPQGSERGASPVLDCIKLQVTPRRWTAVATDRYVVAELSAPMGDYVHTLDHNAPTPLTLLLDSADVVQMVKIVKARAEGGKWVTLTTDDHHPGVVTLQDARAEVLGDYPLQDRSYPAVERLFPTDPTYATDSTHFNPDFLTRLAKVWTPTMASKPSERKAVPVRFQFTEGHSMRNPIGPILVTRPNLPKPHNGIGETFRALIQPNIVLS